MKKYWLLLGLLFLPRMANAVAVNCHCDIGNSISDVILSPSGLHAPPDCFCDWGSVYALNFTNLNANACWKNLPNVFGVGSTIDASQATSTKPWRSGTTLPGTCVTTEAFQKTNDTGIQVYVCVATNTWVRLDQVASGVSAGTYGNANHPAIVTFDASGRATSASTGGTALAGQGSCGANQFETADGASAPTCAQPSFSNLSGSATSGQLPGTVVYNDADNTFTGTHTQNFSSSNQTVRVPLKSDPGSPVTGEIWVNSGAVKVRDNAGSPATQTLVNTLRSISTTAPLTGGGDLSANRTFACNVASASQDGCLAQADFSTFNNKVGTSRTISTTAPITGGGDLSANRTFACTTAASGVAGCLNSTDWDTFNNKVSTSRTISTTAPITGGGDLSANRTFACTTAASGVAGCLNSTDWDTFNNKISGLTGSTTVDLNPGASACADSAAFAVTNAADGDPCSVGGVNAAWSANANLDFHCYVSSAGNVKIRACCHNATACADAGSRTYKVFIQH